jgi:hypothetical protein
MLASRKVDKGFLLIAPFRYVLQMLGAQEIQLWCSRRKRNDHSFLIKCKTVHACAADLRNATHASSMIVSVADYMGHSCTDTRDRKGSHLSW